MDYEYNYHKITLNCIIEPEEKDCFDAQGNHYTIQDGVYIEAVYHKGQDIHELLSEEVLKDILEQFEKDSDHDYQ